VVLQSLARNRYWYVVRYWVSHPLIAYKEGRKEKTAHFHVSPILASSHADLAPASIHVAGVDTLTSEGIAYHEALVKAGTSSTLKVYEGCGHPFGHWDGELDKAKDFVRCSIAALKKAYTIS